jgi:hypothetical protein
VNHHRSLCILILFISVFASSRSAKAQWVVVNLHPSGADASYANGAGGTQQAGTVTVGGFRASLWNGSANSWTLLHPSAATHSYAFGTDGAQQVGYAVIGDDQHAALWSGTAASWIDLHPTGAGSSMAYAVDGGKQGGWVTDENGNWHASLWSGSASSWVDLHPFTSAYSAVLAVSGGQQGGYAISMPLVLTTPPCGPARQLPGPTCIPQVFSESRINGMSTIQQVGFASSGYSHAGLWNGSAASWVDLHPTGAVTSEAFDTDGSIQVGFVNFTSLESGKRASLWNGSAASWISLHDLLPADFDCSVANRHRFRRESYLHLRVGAITPPRAGRKLCFGLPQCPSPRRSRWLGLEWR